MDEEDDEFSIHPFFQKIERIWILSAGIGVKIELFNIVLETCKDYMENSVKNSEQFALFSFSEWMRLQKGERGDITLADGIILSVRTKCKRIPSVSDRRKE